MQDKLKELLEKIKAWWQSFTVKQRTIIVTAAAAILLAFVVLITFLSRPKYSLLADCESTKEASQITELLDGGSINYKVSDDALRIEVASDQMASARLLMAANGIPAASYGIENVTSGGFSTTEADKQKKYIYYLSDRLEKDFIGMFTSIHTASVMLNVPENNGTLISKEEEASASIVLGVDEDFTTDNAAFLARAVATALGNKTTENITIMDNEGNMLYSGNDDFSTAGSANSQMSVKQQAEKIVAAEVKRVLQGADGFDAIEVAGNLDMDFSRTTQTTHEYYPPTGATQGVLAQETLYNSESTYGGGDIPGTDPNDEGTTYTIKDYANENSTVTEEDRKYLPNEQLTEKIMSPGVIQYATSSLAVTATDYVVIKEEDAKRQGLLDGITWDEYKAANSLKTKLEVDADIVDVVAKATGIPAENISIVAYSENWFIDKEGFGVSTQDMIVFILIALILLLLAFVIIRSMMKDRRKQEEEEELPVETILQSTPEPEIDDIEVETKSETRKMIEKFVEENPEAAASLLRNWLTEDWG